MLQQYNRERKDERVVGEATEQAAPEGEGPAIAVAGRSLRRRTQRTDEER